MFRARFLAVPDFRGSWPPLPGVASEPAHCGGTPCGRCGLRRALASEEAWFKQGLCAISPRIQAKSHLGVRKATAAIGRYARKAFMEHRH